MINVGIYGATGYMGGELIRVCLEHPQIEISWATSRQFAQGLDSFHPNLFQVEVNFIHPDAITPCDAYLVALPTETAITVCQDLLQLGGKVIDLSAAFRLKNKKTWETVYGTPHTAWQLTEESVYGITELHPKEISEARLVANPGCYSSAVILALAPLLNSELIDENNLTVSGLSGTSGVGTDLDRAAHHPEIGNNLVPYNVVGHRHTWEMEQELGQVARGSARVHFTPVYVPIIRGILAISHVVPTSNFTKSEVEDCFSQFYRNSKFVKLYNIEPQHQAPWQYRPYPWVSTVTGTNYCFIGFDIDHDRNRLVVFSVLDNLGKGGAHVAIENLNIMFNLPRTMGLTRLGLHPN